MSNEFEIIKDDYHFHLNLPKNEKKTEKKISKIYSRFRDLGTSAVIITEHAFKAYVKVWRLMDKYKQDGFFVFSGVEYVTKENIDIIIFPKIPSIYNYNLEPFGLIFEKVVSLVKTHPDIVSFVTHPFTLAPEFFLIKKVSYMQRRQLMSWALLRHLMLFFPRSKIFLKQQDSLNFLKTNQED